jgi:hypothetical protein
MAYTAPVPSGNHSDLDKHEHYEKVIKVLSGILTAATIIVILLFVELALLVKWGNDHQEYAETHIAQIEKHLAQIEINTTPKK